MMEAMEGKRRGPPAARQMDSFTVVIDAPFKDLKHQVGGRSSWRKTVCDN